MNTVAADYVDMSVAGTNRDNPLSLGALALSLVMITAAGCSQSREPAANQTAITDGKSSAPQSTQSDSSSRAVPAQSATKTLPNPPVSERRTAAEQEFDRLLALADASLAAGRLDEAQSLYEKCRQIRDDRRVAEKLAAIGFVKQAHDSIAQARTMANNSKVLIEQAVKLDAAIASFSKIDADTKHAFASINRELRTDTQWLFGQLVDHCERARKQCTDIAASAYNKNELLTRQKQLARLAEALQNARQRQEDLLSQSSPVETAKSTELKNLADEVAGLTDLQRKLDLVAPAYQLVRKANGQARFSAADHDRLADTRLTFDKILGIFDDARKQVGGADRTWLDAEIKRAEEQREDLRVLMVLFGFEKLEKPIRIAGGAFATAPAEWPQEIDLQLAFAAVTGTGAIKNSFLERGDKTDQLRLTSGKTMTLSSRSLEIQLISKSPVGEDIVLLFGCEQHPAGYLPNLSVARVAKYKPSLKAEYEFSTNITTNLGIDPTRPLPQKPIHLRILSNKAKDGKANALRFLFDDKPLNHRPTQENPKGQPFEIVVNDNFCQVRLALHNAPGLLAAVHDLSLKSPRSSDTSGIDP